MLVCELANAFAVVNISATLIVKASEVSLTSVITSLVTDGRILLMTCGKIITKNVCILEYPNNLASLNLTQEVAGFSCQ